MSSEDSSSGTRPSTRAPLQSPLRSQPKSPIRSQQLDRTLLELESAFNDWECLSSVKSGLATENELKATGSQRSEEEFRQKTKKLLNQLRRQLAEL